MLVVEVQARWGGAGGGGGVEDVLVVVVHAKWGGACDGMGEKVGWGLRCWRVREI